MKKDYNDYMEEAEFYKEKLDEAIDEEDEKRITYYRGKYLFCLKKAYRFCRSDDLLDEIQNQSQEHIKQINSRMKENRKEKVPSIKDELALKYKKLATRISQVNLGDKSQKKYIALDATSLAASSLIKAPVMGAAKIVSKAGPLAIKLCTIPLNLVVSILIFFDKIASNDKNPEYSYENTPVNKLSKTLQESVKELSTTIYTSVAKL